jgi:hypothetical protein
MRFGGRTEAGAARQNDSAERLIRAIKEEKVNLDYKISVSA